jgi:carboxyl-terminal processing protease
MTVGHFFSPLGHTIDKVGVKPDIAVKEEMAHKVAELLLSGLMSSSAASVEGYDKLTVDGQVFDISLATLRSEEYWSSWNEVLSTLPSTAKLQEQRDSWQQASPEELALRWPLFYPDYSSLSSLKDLAPDSKFTVHFASPVPLSSVTPQTVELIAADDGKRVPVSFKALNSTDWQVTPQVPLQAGTECWLVVHSDIPDLTGHSLGKGSVTVARTAGSPVQN